MAGTRSEFDLGASAAPPFGIREYAFADAGNLEHCAKYLNQTLVTFGFPASLDLFATDPVSIARTCNCIHSLLQQRQRDIEFRDASNEQRQRLQSDISRLEAKVERLEAQLAAKDRELATLTRTEAKKTASLKAQIDKLQQERDEYQKMVIGNQQVRTQQIHEMKKKEKEYIKLQERLNQVLMEKKKESRSGMEIMNLLQKEGRQRGTWNGKKADNDFYKMIVDAYEVKKQELMAENSDLRALLRSMQGPCILFQSSPLQCIYHGVSLLFYFFSSLCIPSLTMDMRDFLNAPSGLSQQTSTVNERQDADSPESPLGGRTDVFDLPFHMARDQIEESLRTKMASIKSRMSQLQDAQKGAELTCEATERELELEAQLVEARSIIQEQASIMSKHLAKNDKPRRLSSHFDAEREVTHSTSAEVL
ncbi:hypothetical protein C4D60_Mb07t23550 [Musa balbisiana]|uniref:Afadin-and alpha-actinin-binding protein n=1 Tax=Musa balbisiana TaxID=52838 RepID=A0A4S8JJF9_MUSBA|nr:hypothetical protein C4D60_Mb07t23550 [Musa balbisiana]